MRKLFFGVCKIVGWLTRRAPIGNNFLYKIEFFIIENYLKIYYKDLISKYKDIILNIASGEKQKYKIWTIWWQGEDELPETIKITIQSMKQFAALHEVVVLSRENICQYVDIDNIILEKVDCGLISYTHMSDIVRYKILNQYGGLYLDATTLVVSEIQDSFFGDLEFWTIRNERKELLCPSKGRWCVATLFSSKNSMLVDYMDSFITEYWMQEKRLINYFLIDYLLDIAYSSFPWAKEIIDNMDNGWDFFLLENVANQPYKKDILDSIMEKGFLYRLSYKKDYSKYINRNETLYGYICKKVMKEEKI